MTAGQMERLSSGMRRDEVLRILGEPDQMRKFRVEIFQYRLRPNAFTGEYQEHVVILKNGEVLAYGKLEDFGFLGNSGELLGFLSDGPEEV